MAVGTRSEGWYAMTLGESKVLAEVDCSAMAN